MSVTSQLQPAALVVNTHSRRGERLYKQALRELQRQQIELAAAYPVRTPNYLPKVIQEHIEKGYRLIIVGGGDGTMTSVIDHFVERDVVLGLLPLGTGNSFARSVGIPLSLKGAIEVIARGKLAKVDVAKLDGNYFANAASIGLTAEMSRRVTRKLKRFLGILAYLVIGVPLFFKHKSFQAKVILPEATRSFTTHQLVIANGGIYGVSPITPDAHVDNNQLVVYTMASLGRWQMLQRWLELLLGYGKSSRGAYYFTTQKVRIETDTPQYVEVDGEVVTQTPIEIVVAPDVLTMIVPQDFRDV